MPIAATHLVDDVMQHWPATIQVFLKYKMRCIGCPIGCFHTLDDACREHGTDSDLFVSDLRAAIAGQSAASQKSTVLARWPEDA